MNQPKVKILSRVLLWSIAVMGGTLVIFLFLFIIPADKRTPIVWLNFGVILWLVLLTLIVFTMLILRSKNHSDSLPAFITFGTIVALYDIITLIIVFLSFIDLSFKIFVTAHAITLFLFLSSTVITFLAVSTAHSVQEAQAIGQDKKVALKNAFEAVSFKINKLPSGLKELKKQFDGIQDEVRYVSPGTSTEAEKYECEIYRLLGILDRKIDFIIDNQENEQVNDVRKTMDELKEYVIARKKIYAF